MNKNYTIDYTEYFDYQNQRAATHVTVGGKWVFSQYHIRVHSNIKLI